MTRQALTTPSTVSPVRSAAARAIGSRLEDLEPRRLYAASAESHWYDYYVSGDALVGQSLAGAMGAASGKTTAPAAAAPAANKAPPLRRPGAPDLQPRSDDGKSNKDDVTSVTSPWFDVAKVDANVTLQLLRDGAIVASVDSGAGGTVAIRDAGPVPAGVHVYTARVINAGVVSDASNGLKVTFQVTTPPPPAAPSAPDLQPGSDTGSSSGDNLTAADTLAFTIAGVQSGLTVRLLRDGAVVASGVADGSSFALVDATATSDGSHTYTAVTVDGFNQASAAGAPLVVTIDRTGPAMPAVPDLRAADDTGSSSTDNITARNSGLTFDVAGVEIGATVELLRDGAVVASGIATSGSIALMDAAALADGAYHYVARQIDLAGNVSVVSGMITVTVDTTAPTSTVMVALADGSDTGIKGDGLTTLRRPVFEVAGVDAGATVQLLCDGVVVATRNAGANGVTLQSSVQLSAGTHAFTARQVDAAGNPAPGASDSLTVKIVNALANSDFDGDGVSDPAVYTGGAWQVLLSAGGSQSLTFGNNTAVPFTGDFDGDGKTDLGHDIASVGVQYVRLSTDPQPPRAMFVGYGNDVPVPGDFDGDGKTDMATYFTALGWFTVTLSSGGETTIEVPGVSYNSIPVVADYDGDGVCDAAVYDADAGTWTVVRSTDGQLVTRSFAAFGPDEQPLAADYDGDGFADLALYDPATATFRVLESATGEVTVATVGTPGSVAVAGDYDGDGKIDFATFAASTGTWSIVKSSTGTTTTVVMAGTTSASMPLPLSPLQASQAAAAA
jgi:hypothetical protein